MESTAPSASPPSGGGGGIPSGSGILTNPPELFIPLELVFGGLVWILVAATKVFISINQGWVMFVSVILFVSSSVLLVVFFIGLHKSSSSNWGMLDAFYHGIAAILYFSAAVLQANATVFLQWNGSSGSQIYKIDVAATVFAFLATMIYVVHAVLSFTRWKSG
ncbi:myelin and lymphocyte protein-like [Latimeria chalumnae]|uniref:myelin and lymphocyte protein-like n=1 Tax=Latimeria chalumnae TaxID=7897 RepID=UPI0003C150A2|nr:PREDICTED: myelin and lymphocyte protein-like [Latimeria chalumnae]|eukprot:XP_006013674.1 PREDICTED: myelin and lymphocyte protein-like [Latimeria chalumnae]